MHRLSNIGRANTFSSSYLRHFDRTIEFRGSQQLIRAVDVILHLQLQLGPSEQLSQGVLSDGRLLQDDHSLLIAELVTTTIYISDCLS